MINILLPVQVNLIYDLKVFETATTHSLLPPRLLITGGAPRSMWTHGDQQSGDHAGGGAEGLPRECGSAVRGRQHLQQSPQLPVTLRPHQPTPRQSRLHPAGDPSLAPSHPQLH